MTTENFPTAQPETNLHTALTAPPGSWPPNISPQILQMFYRGEKNEKEGAAYQRFVGTQAYYNDLIDSHQPALEHAVFYRLEDKGTIEDLYQKTYFNIIKEFKNHVNQLTSSPSSAEIKYFLQSLKTDVMHEDLINFMLNNDITPLETQDHRTIDDFFDELDNEGNTRQDNEPSTVKELARRRFYKVNDFETACNEGTIYRAEAHNWGRNAAWALAITQKQVPIQILSALDEKSSKRSFVASTKPAKAEALGPSAFALEMAIAQKMGYTLVAHADGRATLTPPVNPVPVVSNGEAGNGVLPSIEEQFVIFNNFSQQYKAQMAEHLEGLGPQNFEAYVHKASIAPYNMEKKNLINTLQYMIKSDSLPILANLSLPTYEKLQKMLESDSFKDDSYSLLKKLVQAHQEKALLLQPDAFNIDLLAKQFIAVTQQYKEEASKDKILLGESSNDESLLQSNPSVIHSDLSSTPSSSNSSVDQKKSDNTQTTNPNPTNPNPTTTNPHRPN